MYLGTKLGSCRKRYVLLSDDVWIQSSKFLHPTLSIWEKHASKCATPELELRQRLAPRLKFSVAFGRKSKLENRISAPSFVQKLKTAFWCSFHISSPCVIGGIDANAFVCSLQCKYNVIRPYIHLASSARIWWLLPSPHRALMPNGGQNIIDWVSRKKIDNHRRCVLNVCTHFYSPPDFAAKLDDSKKICQRQRNWLLSACYLIDSSVPYYVHFTSCMRFPRIHYLNKLFNDFNVFMTASPTQYTRCRQYYYGFISAFTVIIISIWLQDFSWSAQPLLSSIETITLFFRKPTFCRYCTGWKAGVCVTCVR